MKSKFIIDELWALSVAGAFQRANIYKPDINDENKKEFKKALKNELELLVQKQYSNPVNENIHIENIYALSAYSKKFSKLLKNGEFNFGVSQKILNLFLKYIWCLKLIPTPPHFPVDRMIQIKLNSLASEKNLKIRKVTPWTQFEVENQYLEIIRFAESMKKNDHKFSGMSLAEMELALFNRR